MNKLEKEVKVGKPPWWSETSSASIFTSISSFRMHETIISDKDRLFRSLFSLIFKFELKFLKKFISTLFFKMVRFLVTF